MNDPAWLRGQTRSESSVLRWREEDDRQFCVLPFYEGNRVEQGRECYMLSLGEGKLRHLLQDTSPRTAVEAGDGHFPAVKAKSQVSRLSSASELAAIFDECVMPAQLQQSTRVNYWGSWKTVLTWGVAHEEVKSLLPMTQETLKAITQEMLMVGCAAGTIRNLWSAIEDRHRIFGYMPPLALRGGDFSRFS
jgi:hypothetical protein